MFLHDSSLLSEVSKISNGFEIGQLTLEQNDSFFCTQRILLRIPYEGSAGPDSFMWIDHLVESRLGRFRMIFDPSKAFIITTRSNVQFPVMFGGESRGQVGGLKSA